MSLEHRRPGRERGRLGGGGAAQAVGSAASGAAGQIDPQAAIDRARMALTAPSDPARMTTEQRSAEIASLVGTRVTQGNLSDADRQRLARLVGAEAGIPEAEAAQRIQASEAQAQRVAREAEQRAREAADATATATATSAVVVLRDHAAGGRRPPFSAHDGNPEPGAGASAPSARPGLRQPGRGVFLPPHSCTTSSG
jgi:hypothetical protein